MDTYAADLATLIETLDLKNVIHVGHSTGGGKVARYIGRLGTKRVAKAVLISAVPLHLACRLSLGGRFCIEDFIAKSCESTSVQSQELARVKIVSDRRAAGRGLTIAEGGI